VSMDTSWVCVVGFGWVGCGICVVGLLASVVLSMWPLAPWDEPLARGSLVGLFLGSISWGFFKLTAL
jgi:hypothetical protein